MPVYCRCNTNYSPNEIKVWKLVRAYQTKPDQILIKFWITRGLRYVFYASTFYSHTKSLTRHSATKRAYLISHILKCQRPLSPSNFFYFSIFLLSFLYVHTSSHLFYTRRPDFVSYNSILQSHAVVKPADFTSFQYGTFGGC